MAKITNAYTLGFIGAGQMARALAKGFVDQQLISPTQIAFFDPAKPAVSAFQQIVPGARTCANNADVVHASDTVWVAVKPQNLASLSELWPPDAVAEKLFVSIVAGATIRRLSDILHTARVIRVMPNTPAIVGAAATAYCRGPAVLDGDLDLVHALLCSVGYAVAVREDLLDAVTGLSGSGPAYAFLMLEALADGGVLAGLSREVAAELAVHTLYGAAKLALETGDHPAILKDRVASPGGTTIAGLQALESGGFHATVMQAVVAATRRAQELGQE